MARLLIVAEYSIGDYNNGDLVVKNSGDESSKTIPKPVLKDIKNELIQACEGFPLRKTKAFEEDTNVIALRITKIAEIMDKYINEDKGK